MLTILIAVNVGLLVALLVAAAWPADDRAPLTGDQHTEQRRKLIRKWQRRTR